MKLLLLLLFPFYLAAYQFTVASYNLYNLFDDVYDGTEYSDFKPPKWGEKDYQQKLKKMARVIQDIDAQIIALLEIENENALLGLKAKLPKYNYYAIDTKEGSAISVALLSKYPIIKSRTITVKGEARDILKVVTSVQGNKLALYINHWQSLRAPEPRRVNYAKALMQKIEKSDYDEYILIGDFNSNYNHYLQQKGRVGINHILRTVTDSGALTQKHSLTAKQHYNLWQDTDFDRRFSYIFRGNRFNTLDHIIIPKTLLNSSGINYVSQSFDRFDPDYLFSNGRINYDYSDHLAIFAQFSTQPYSSQKKPLATTDIKTLYKQNGLQSKAVIESATLIYKDRYGGIIKDSSGKAIYIFRPNLTLPVGQSYDILVGKTDHYHGLLQITRFDILNVTHKTIDAPYLVYNGQDLERPKNISQVVKRVWGQYRDGEFIYGDGEKSIDIYFQDRSKKVESGTDIVLKNVRIGLFRGDLQLVVSDTTKVLY